MDIDIHKIAQTLGMRLQQRNLTVTTAESCTGGGVAQAITSIAGSSKWFHTGFVTYADWSKQQQLGVSQENLCEFGAVSEMVAREMVEGALLAAKSDIAVAVTGIAGPDGGSAEKPVGTVWLAWASKNSETICQCMHFDGNRDQVREQAVACALDGLLSLID
ncbi:MAG: nicotinamide-nucleotide amidohydrolase family protein [Cellvibrionaceae bacterium]